MAALIRTAVRPRLRVNHAFHCRSSREGSLRRSRRIRAREMLRIVASRMRGALGLIEELSFSSVRGRLAAYLLRLASREQGEPQHRIYAVASQPRHRSTDRHGPGVTRATFEPVAGRGCYPINRRTMRIPDLRLLAREISRTSSFPSGGDIQVQTENGSRETGQPIWRTITWKPCDGQIDGTFCPEEACRASCLNGRLSGKGSHFSHSECIRFTELLAKPEQARREQQNWMGRGRS